MMLSPSSLEVVGFPAPCLGADKGALLPLIGRPADFGRLGVAATDIPSKENSYMHIMMNNSNNINNNNNDNSELLRKVSVG